MDHVQEHEQGKTHERLKEKQRRVVSPVQNVSLNIWDSNESDTESLAEERAYQQALLKRINGHVEVVTQPKDDVDPAVLKQMEKQDVDYKEQGEECLDVYDSLEVSTHRPDQRNYSPVSSIQFPDNHQMDDTEVTRDRYSDLRYDPNWRTNLREAGRFHNVHRPQNMEERSEESHSDREGRSTRGGYSYAIVRNPVLSENATPDMMGNQLATQHHFESYHLHPQEMKATRENPPLLPHHLHVPSNHNVTAGPRDSKHLPTNTPSEGNGSRTRHRNDQVKQVGMNSTHPDHNPCSSPEPEQDSETRDRHGQEFQTCYELQREAQAGGTVGEKQFKYSLRQKGPQQVSKTMKDKPKEDIIERNRTTLGIQAAKSGGSYLKAHSQKGEKSDTSTQVTDASDEITTAGSMEGGLEDSPDPELRWLLQARQLRMTQKKAQWRGNPPEKRPTAPGGQARQGDRLSPATSEPTARPLPQPQLQPHPRSHPHFPQPSHPSPRTLSETHSTFSSPSHPGLQTHPAPSVHLHINLHSSSDLLPLLHQSRQDLTSTSPGGPHILSHSSSLPLTRHLHAPLPVPYHGVTLAASPGPLSPPALVPLPRLGVPARPSPFGVGMAAEPSVWTVWNQGGSPAGWPGDGSTRVNSPRWHLSCPDNQNQIVNVDSSALHPADSQKYRPAVYKHQPGSRAGLPPIGHLMKGQPTGAQGNGTQKTNIQRSCSDGYLAQMEKQMQLKERLTYKAYTLRDYQRLKQDLKLGGLGPVFTADDVTVEKMRRQKLYSNVIREQNKKISRMPTLPARKPVGQDKKDEVPRKKALEYAKSIPRPVPPSKPPSMPREGDRGEGVSSDRASYLEGVDLSQLATLDLLRKRHEEEKAAVAHFQVLPTWRISGLLP
ncbi:jhy protein homolog [Osmerus eperlanus]|uniref:jhy protein homolog n=1 Tax=Osmerus eperlanus TaxID=29151 RepID=UPI002E0D7E76